MSEIKSYVLAHKKMFLIAAAALVAVGITQPLSVPPLSKARAKVRISPKAVSMIPAFSEMR